MGRVERLAIIQDIERLRDSNVICYLTSTRPNIESQMALDIIPVLHRHLQLIAARPNRKRRLDLFIHSNGGEGVVPWRLVTLLREFSEEFCLLVPNRAFSAATLTALGADEVVMHPMGMLGPTDPTVANAFNPPDPRNPSGVLGISVEDVASYFALVKDEVGIHHEDELVQALNSLTAQIHPLALGNVKRSTSQSRMMGEKLLKARRKGELSDHERDQIIRRLTSELFYHGHPINRAEARDDLGLTWVVDPPPDLEAAMWSLFSDYESEMKLNKEFLPIDEAIAQDGLPVIPPQAQVMTPAGPAPAVTVQTSLLPPQLMVVLESVDRIDWQEQTIQVNIRRQWIGDMEAAIVRTAMEWKDA